MTRDEIRAIVVEFEAYREECVDALHRMMVEESISELEGVIKSLEPYFLSTTLFRKVENYCINRIAELRRELEPEA